jgi:GNAT superfamily N-acetyltransferase
VSRQPFPFRVRRTRLGDYDAIRALTLHVYPGAVPWRQDQIASHLEIFPQGQFVAVERGTSRVVGMAASLIVYWDDYEFGDTWRDFTAGGLFLNHDPAAGRTLYGAEVMVDPGLQGRGIGRRLYEAREKLARQLGLLRIRAGARLRGYGAHADRMTPREYVDWVVRGEIRDPTLTFQLRRGFRVLGVVSGYLQHDPESRGYAAIIEWLNPERAAEARAPAASPTEPAPL